MGATQHAGACTPVPAGVAAERARQALQALPRPLAELPRLHRGRHGPGDPDAKGVAEIQCARLRGALMVELGAHGEGLPSTRALYRRAEVSKEAFYHHYKGGVHECFMEVLDHVSDAVVEHLASVWRAAEGRPASQRLAGAVEAFARLTAERPEPVRIALCSSFTVGPAAAEAERAVEDRLQALLLSGLREGGVEVQPLVARATLAGLAAVARARLLEGRQSELPRQGPALARWACCCLQAPAPGASAAASAPALRPLETIAARPCSPELPVLDRVLIRTAQLAIRDGGATPTENDIRRPAGVSRAELEASFASPSAILTALLEACWKLVLRHAGALARGAPDSRHALVRGLSAVLACVAQDQIFARLAFVDLARRGEREAIRERATLMRDVAAALCRGLPKSLRPPAVVAEASVAAAWSLVCGQVAEGRARDVHALSNPLCFIVLAPMIGPQAALQTLGIDASRAAEIPRPLRDRPGG